VRELYGQDIMLYSVFVVSVLVSDTMYSVFVVSVLVSDRMYSVFARAVFPV
jgi:hypothetical protein